MDYLVDQYFSGNTPNPCIQCNTHLRWGGLIQKADDLNAKWIATGHYARIDELKGVGKVIRKGVDETKDQSYVLWGISEDLLERTLFPLGNLRKKEVREIARKEGLVTAEIAESQEICFIPDADYRRFLKEYVPDRAGTEEKGAMVSLDGEVVGEHRAFHNTLLVNAGSSALQVQYQATFSRSTKRRIPLRWRHGKKCISRLPSASTQLAHPT